MLPVVAAHIQLSSPVQRTTEQKAGPCGAAGSTRSDHVTTYRPGETITVRWNETVDHPGHFRISFDADGDDDFVNPTSYDDRDSNEAVLLDGIADHDGGGAYTAEVTLPDITCDRCTLQVIQVMTDKPPFSIPGNDIYYQCADLVLSEDAPPPVDTADDDGGCTVAGGDAGLWLVLGALLVLRRRQPA